MTKSEIVEKVNGFLIEEFEIEPDSIIKDANLQEALELDSLDYVDLVVIIENTFGFKVTGEDFKSISTIDDFYNFICNKLNCE